MSTQDKRAIVDKIFGFHILNQMRETLKGEVKKVKEEVDKLRGSLNATERSILQSNEEMESLLEQIEQESKDQLDQLNESLDKFKNLQAIHSSKVDLFKSQESQISSLVSDASKSLVETRSEYQDLERRLKLYESDKCPTCESSLTTEFHTSVKDSLISDKNSSFTRLEECEGVLNDVRRQESEIRTQRNDLQEKGSKIQSKISEILREIQRISSNNVDNQVSSLKRILEKLETDKNKLESDLIKTDERNLWIKKLDEVLGEKGVKQMAVKTILPSLNSEILDLLREMSLEYQVIFDDEFKATLYHMGAEIPVQTLSTGEMKKVDFVVLIAIMKLMKLKFSTINLLFLDELFSSVDPEGVYSILKILKKNSKDMGLNIFVINHAPMPHEIFDWKLEVSKTNNFSSISIDKF
jgi:DNA repair exonuclease SbcCD ATPase subunit